MDDNGHYFVIISHNRSIRIAGDSFGVYCTICGELIYFKDSIIKTNLIAVKVNRFIGGTIGTN